MIDKLWKIVDELKSSSLSTSSSSSVAGDMMLISVLIPGWQDAHPPITTRFSGVLEYFHFHGGR